MAKEKKTTTKKKVTAKGVKKKEGLKAKPRKVRVEKEAMEKIEKEKIEKTKEEITRVKYFEGVGRRKTAVARVRLFTRGEKTILINDKPLANYFSDTALEQTATSALTTMRCLDKFRVLVKVRGGGLHAQAEAIRHGTARALVLFNPDFRKRLRKAGYLTRDSRERERKKFGLKRARRAPQWQKR
jgi:small subunit ribosomal protein S9